MTGVVERVRARLGRRVPKKGPETLRPAAVLVPIVTGPGAERSLLFTRRADTLRRQPGDIAFPGGAIEHRDPSPLATALRESHEEVGLKPEDVELLGQMDARGTVTGFCITPFVGAVEGPYPFRPNHEVEELFEVSIEALMDPEVLEVEHRTLPDGSVRKVYHYRYRDYDIWGITGQLVHDFLDLIR